MTFLIRQLAPTEKGLPIEIYVFVNDVRWIEYEAIQSDIFDHLIAALPVFNLRAFQLPSDASFAHFSQSRGWTWIRFFVSGCRIFFYDLDVVRKMVLADLSSDGCSLFLDWNFEDSELWNECCILHDIAYWQVGSKAEREDADQALKHCVEKKTGNPKLAALMFRAVRAWVGPSFSTWYRWG